MQRLPKLARFILYHAATGIALGCVFTLILIWTNTANLGHLLSRDATGLATAVLFFQMAMTFGAISAGIAIMGIGEEDHKD